MKTKQTLVSGFLAVILTMAFGACSATAQEQRMTGGGSFRFTVINGNAYSVSAGTATEGAITIPAYYRPNADSDYLPVTSIGTDAFNGRKNIVRITIPSTVTSIGGRAFQNCTGLASITIPNSVTFIHDWAFNNCTSLTSITLPASVTSIGCQTFLGCTGLTSITIPASVTYIKDRAFLGWNAAQTIYIQGHANRESTIAAEWSEYWDKSGLWERPIEANIVYQGGN